MAIAVFDLLQLTYKSLRGNLLRSSLTGFGVFMGVAAVCATLQVGSISQAVIAGQLAKRDAPKLVLGARWNPITRSRAHLQLEDLEALRTRLVGLQAISYYVWYRSRNVVFQTQLAQPEMGGVSLAFLETSGRSLVAGRFFNQADFNSYRPVVIIDDILAKNLFSSIQEAVDKKIYVENRPYFVVGVIESKLQFQGEEPDGLLLFPGSLVIALTGRRNIGWLSLRPEKIEDLDKLETQAKSLLKKRFPGHEFWFGNNVDDIIEQQKTLEMTSRGLLAVGIIALLVGGVGIANITIASVVERTPEIGLRKAIGARARDIMLQFVLEAALLSFVGGSAAIATVHGITSVVAENFALPYKFDRNVAALALGSALLVGVGASFFPALRASKLDPVYALRNN